MVGTVRTKVFQQFDKKYAQELKKPSALITHHLMTLKPPSPVLMMDNTYHLP
jgi:hypothetical protein